MNLFGILNFKVENKFQYYTHIIYYENAMMDILFLYTYLKYLHGIRL